MVAPLTYTPYAVVPERCVNVPLDDSLKCCVDVEIDVPVFVAVDDVAEKLISLTVATCLPFVCVGV